MYDCVCLCNIVCDIGCLIGWFVGDAVVVWSVVVMVDLWQIDFQRDDRMFMCLAEFLRPVA